MPISLRADQCRLDLAHVLEVKKQFDDAGQMLQEVAQHDHSPWAEMALLQLGAKQLADKKPQAALELYEAIEKRFPNTPLLPQTHLGCGRALYQLGHFTEAVGVLSPLADDKQLGTAARYWIALSQKADSQQKFAAAQKARQEEESARAEATKAETARAEVARAEADKAAQAAKALAAANASKPSSLPLAAAQQTPPGSEKSVVVSSRRTQHATPTVQQPAPEAVVVQPTEEPSTQKPVAEKFVSDDPNADNNTTEKSNNSASTGTPWVAASSPKAGLQQPPSVAGSGVLDDQSRRRSAMIRYQQADAMIRARQFDRAIGMLEIGDNSGDDPSSLSNRYLLALALQGAARRRGAANARRSERHAASQAGCR